MLAMLFCACDEKRDSVNEDSIEAQNEISGEMHENDTNMVMRDGTLLPGALDQIDSVRLPGPILAKITEDAALSKDRIAESREFTENGRTYFEVKFQSQDGKMKTVIFDENGSIKS